jgi:TonB family protein
MAGETGKVRRVLKFGLVQDGKIIEEGILGEKEGMTIGADPSNTISVTDLNIPKRHRLMEPHANGYKLTAFRGLEGKISLGDKVLILDVASIENVGVKKGKYREILLPASSKGKLVLGRTTILFQLVPPPPPPPILKLPKELRGNVMSGFDLFFFAVILLSALFHISLVTYLNTLEVTDELTTAEIQKFTKQLVSTEDIEVITEEEPEKEKKDEAKKKKAGGSAKKGGSKEAEDKGFENKGLVGLITKHSGSSGSVADILSEGMGDDLSAVISGISGVDVARSGSDKFRGKRGSGNGQAGGTVEVGDLNKLSSKGTINTGKKIVKKIKSKITSAAGGVTGKIDQSSVYGVIRKRIGGVRFCYESQLKTNPSLAGKIRVQFVIGSSGSVTSCSVVSNSMGNTLVQECICRMVRRWKFSTPDEGTVTVGYTFIFSAVN